MLQSEVIDLYDRIEKHVSDRKSPPYGEFAKGTALLLVALCASSESCVTAIKVVLAKVEGGQNVQA